MKNIILLFLLVLSSAVTAQIIQTEYYTVYDGTQTKTVIIQDTIPVDKLSQYGYQLDTTIVKVNTVDEFNIWNTTEAYRIQLTLPSDWTQDSYIDFKPRFIFIDPETGIQITNMKSWRRKD